MEKVNLFISYAHEDKQHVHEFKKYLNPTTCPNINIWDDNDIRLGEEWNEEILERLRTADIVLLLISQDFLVSTYIQTIELTRALQRHEEGTCTVVPIFLRYSILKPYPEITKLQGYPQPDTPLLTGGIYQDKHFMVIQEKVNEIANNILTNRKIVESTTKDSDDITARRAAELIQLRDNKDIFLSLPASDEGKFLRLKLVLEVQGMIKHDAQSWAYRFVPDTNESQEIYRSAPQAQEQQFKKLLTGSIYYIFVIGTEQDLVDPLFSMQYAIARELNKASSLNHIILWFSNPEAKQGLEKLSEAFRIELKMLPTTVGMDAKNIFNLINQFDAAKQVKISKLASHFSPVKKVYMFYNYEKDNENELRIQLRKKLQEDKNFAVRDLADEPFENEKKGIEECRGAIIFYGADCDSVWYKMRERTILKAKNIKLGAVCVDGKEDPEIEKKIDRDVSVNEILPIKGEKELENGVKTFKQFLQED